VRTRIQVAANEVMEVCLQSLENGVGNRIENFRIENANEVPTTNCHSDLDRGHVTIRKFGLSGPGSTEETWRQEVSSRGCGREIGDKVEAEEKSLT